MLNWFKRKYHLERHRLFQVTITIGVCVSTAIGYFLPYHGEFAIAAGVATNLLWIWEH